MDTAPKPRARITKALRKRHRTAPRPLLSETFEHNAPPGFDPVPCPACKTMPACNTTKEILGGFLECTAVFVACPNAECPAKPLTKTFGLPEWSEKAAAKLEKMALFEWNNVAAATAANTVECGRPS